MAASDIFFYIEPYPLTNLLVIRNKGLSSETVVTPTDTGSSYTVHELEGSFTISADGYITTTEPVYDGMGILTITLQPVKYISNLSDGTNTYVIKDAEARSSISNLATVATSGSYNDLSNKPTIPNTVSSVSSSSTNADAVGAKLFYDTVGDIESALYAINSGGAQTITLTFVMTGTTANFGYLNVNNTTYQKSNFNNNSLSLEFESGTNISWSATPQGKGSVTPSSGTLTITEDTSITINVT